LTGKKPDAAVKGKQLIRRFSAAKNMPAESKINAATAGKIRIKSGKGMSITPPGHPSSEDNMEQLKYNTKQTSSGQKQVQARLLNK